MQIRRSPDFLDTNTAGVIHGLLLCVIMPCSSKSFIWCSTLPRCCAGTLLGGTRIVCGNVVVRLCCFPWYVTKQVFVLVDYTREGTLCTLRQFKVLDSTIVWNGTFFCGFNCSGIQHSYCSNVRLLFYSVFPE